MNLNFPTPKQFLAFGSGSSKEVLDNSFALQSWLNSPSPILQLDGFYYTTKELYYPSNKRIIGIGKDNCGILAHPLMAKEIGLFMSKNPSFDLYTTGNVVFKDMTFGGELLNNQPRGDACFGALGVSDLRLEGIRFSDWARDGFAGNNIKSTALKDIEFTRMGKQEVQEGNPGEYVGGSLIFLWGEHIDTRISEIYAHDLYGTGGIWIQTYDNSRNTLLTNFRLFGVTEFGVVGAAKGSIISNGIIDGVILAPQTGISGHGMELSHTDYTVSNMSIRNCANTWIYGSNLKDVAFVGGVLRECNQTNAEGGTGIMIASHRLDAGFGDPGVDNLVLTGFTMRCNKPKMAKHAIRFYNVFEDSEDEVRGKMNNVVCYGNSLGGPDIWSDEPIQVDAAARGNHLFTSYSF